MAKTYTAQEMREMANKLPDDYSFADIVSSDGDKQLFSMGCLSSMLRQAADAAERKEKREKKYQYEVWYTAKDGGARRSSGRTISLDSAKRILSMFNEFSDAHIVRREVGEWEEVKDND